MNMADRFLGLTKKSAQDLSDQLNLIFRLIRIDNRDMLSYPDDIREDRICVEIESSKVVKATIQ
jgi:hypothetical protein